MKLAKRIFSLVLVMAILFSMASVIFADEGSGNAGSSSALSDLMNAHNVNPLTGNETEPFNTAGSPVLMNKEELKKFYYAVMEG